MSYHHQHHHHHESSYNPSFRIYSKTNENYSLSVRNSEVILAHTNHHDEYQQWYKDFRWGTEVKDEYGYPAFVLINKATGLAIKHSLGPKKPVRVIPFNPQYLDESILWTESQDVGEGFHCIRMVNNTRLNFDAFHGDNGIYDGTPVHLWEWHNGHNQMWKIVPNSHLHANQNDSFRIYTRAGENYSLSIRNGEVVLAPTSHHDEYQHWYKDSRWGGQVRDEAGFPAFSLINKATGLAIKHSFGPKHAVRLVPFNPQYLDESVLWTESQDVGEGFHCIRMVNNISLNFDAFHGENGVHDGTTVVLWEWHNGKNQSWRIVPFY